MIMVMAPIKAPARKSERPAQKADGGPAAPRTASAQEAPAEAAPAEAAPREAASSREPGRARRGGRQPGRGGGRQTRRAG